MQKETKNRDYELAERILDSLGLENEFFEKGDLRQKLEELFNLTEDEIENLIGRYAKKDENT